MPPLRRIRKAVPKPVKRWVFKALPRRVRDSIRPPKPNPKQLAPIDAAASPLAVRTANLDRVVAALDAAGVAWFRLPTRQVSRSSLAVAESARAAVERVTKALAAEGATVRPIRRRRPPEVTPEQHAAVPPYLVQVFWPVVDPQRGLLIAHDAGCEIEFWAEQDGRLVAPRQNRGTDVVLASDAEVEAGEEAFGDFRAAAGDGRRYRTRAPFLVPPLDHVDFPIDVVYTWVDGADPAWLARKNAALGENDWVTANEQAANESRYISRNELRYSLRSLHAHAPWVRRIFIVTDDQTPEWLDAAHPQITMVSHKEIFGDTGVLPTFNSHAIETRLHRIPGLAEHFVYFNDDVFLGRPVLPSTFFTPSGQTKVFLSVNRIDNGPAQPDDPPIMSAGKNNRALIQRRFGRFLSHKMKHTPHPARRSVIAEIELAFPDEVAATAAHQFRHHSNISLMASLQQHWSVLTGQGVLADLSYMYKDMADPTTPARLAEALAKRDLDVFCLNDTNATGEAAAAQAALLASFLPAYFPFRAPYELPDPPGAGPAPLRGTGLGA
ncbi:stealth family protein [Spirilliplanes yamanashiensis]|uniref:Exopolysaccharide phosphotransferase n=1 Tax=Spirilliplanes yamanashiensis TaxID=42233 RepID=A0A8J4DG07_9ACTN|nr:stealth family protein [Spirilliplanes yamanashiensis]MDP9814167.1 hypothetical protein [Spirilliplanes yamanashiensis]GIJ00851.1 exopolysaccharide phosphotransferase [Spirilliplanes yamanashiensis]